jgi:hypothetical protein
MILSIRADLFGDGHPLSVLLRHDHEFGFPEHNGWKLIEPLHAYITGRGLTYTLDGRWEQGVVEAPRGYYIHANVPGLTDEDVVYISMRWLDDFSLLNAAR